jgi:hypothetical protein
MFEYLVKCRNENPKPKKLKQSNDIRLCSDFDMVERFLLLRTPLRMTCATLEEYFPLNSEEMHLLDMIRVELKPIKTLHHHSTKSNISHF